MNFPLRLRFLREKANLSREELARQLNITYWALSKYESGKRQPDLTTLVKIADFFKVSTDWLLCRTDISDFSTNAKTTVLSRDSSF